MQTKRLFLTLILIYGVCAVSFAAEQPSKTSPTIFFLQTQHDFGKIGTLTKQSCEFKFTNTSSAILKIGKIKSTCGCTVPKLSKTEYQPGEEGAIEIMYSAPGKPTHISKSIYVPTNDPNNLLVKLTITAEVVNLIEVSPQKLQLLLKKDNAAASDIAIKSINDQPFFIFPISIPPVGLVDGNNRRSRAGEA